MANEKNGTKVATVSENGNLLVKREIILDKAGHPLKTQDGRDYFGYVARGTALGREIKVDFAPKDKGGYEPLDLLFMLSDSAELLMHEEVNTDANGRTSKRMVYTLVVYRDDVPYECEVKPQRNSDKALLGVLLNEIALQKKKSTPQTAA